MHLKIGRFILTITKFEHNENGVCADDKSSLKSPLKKKTALHIKRKNPMLGKTKTIYSFESFDAFCDFCTFLDKNPHREEISNFAKSADLYEYNSNYYLIFTDINLESNLIKFIVPSITEFAHVVDNSELFERKITEYGKPIIKGNAISKTTEYFV